MEKPIVTISVITYNSSKYVLETLNSIKAQTYPNISLQISDDCSTDNTIQICSNWLNNNRDRFVKTKILKIDHNTGATANSNRAWKACETDYYKGIAGDDILLPTCIEDYVNYVVSHPESLVIFAKAIPFSTYFGKKIVKPYIHNYNFFSLDVQSQYEYLLYEGNTLPAAAVFYNVKKLLSMGFLHDERIRNMEDYPKWIRLLKMGVKFHYIDKDTVLYRMENTSLSVGLFSPSYFNQEIWFYLHYMLEDAKTEEEKEKLYGAIADRLTRFYSKAYRKGTTSPAYRVGHAILWPARLCSQLFVILKHLSN